MNGKYLLSAKGIEKTIISVYFQPVVLKMWNTTFLF